MKRLGKLISLVLVFSMLLVVFIGCGATKDTGKENDKTDDPAKGDDQGEVVEEPTYDFGGRTITYSAWWNTEPTAGSSEGADNWLERTAQLEEKYNFTLAYLEIPAEEYLEKFVSSNLAGEPMAELAYVASHDFYPGLFLNGFVLPLSDYEAFDFNDPKWDPVSRDTTTFGGKVYGTFPGKFFPRGGLFWNKAIFDREGLPNLYEIQRNKEWTWDKMLEFAKTATKDLDGDGIIDQWGLGGSGTEWAFVISNKANVIDTSGEMPRFALGDPNAIEALQAFQDFAFVHKVFDLGPDGAAWDYPMQQFQDGKYAMLSYDWWITDRFAEGMEDDYGFVFFPMGPKADDYASVAGENNVVVFPSTTKNPEEVAIVWDALTDPFEGEDENEWKIGHYDRAKDTEAVDETIAMMLDGRTTMNVLRGFTELQNIMWGYAWPIVRGQTTPVVRAEEMAPQAQALIEDALSGGSN